MNQILVLQPDAETRRRVADRLAAGDAWSPEAPADADPASATPTPGHFQLVVADLDLLADDDHGRLRTLLRQEPERPVLVTGGDEPVDKVVDVLHAGGAGYVHLDRLDAELPVQVERVVNAAWRNQSRARLLDCMTSSISTFEVGNDPLMLPALLTRLQASLMLFGIGDEAQRTRVGIALEEALSNALYHGNLEVSSKLREESFEAYYKLAAERRTQPPYADRKITVTETLTAEAAAFTIADEGPGFDTAKFREQREPDNHEDPDDGETCPINLEALSGRGFMLMRAFMDEVTYNAAGNEVTLVKRRQPEEDGGDGVGVAA
ncbi:MAG: ATP-binding protein [Planctomycetota bacterium]